MVEFPDVALLVLRPALLLQRFFGHLPGFDVEHGLERAGVPARRRRRFAGCQQHLAEVYAGEALNSQARRHGVRHYDGEQLKAALAPEEQRRTCDASIDDGSRWALFEITSSRLARDSVNASSAERLDLDLDKLVEKIEQLDQTIAGLRVAEAALTGAAPTGWRRYFPVLVMTESFPVDPVTLTVLRARASELSLLRDPDVGPLEVVDGADLEILEGLDPGEPSILAALDAKRSSSLALAGMRDYLLVEREARGSVPARIGALWEVVFELAKRHVRPEARTA